MRNNLFVNRAFITYAVPVIGSSIFIAPINILQGIYAKYYGLSLTTIASIVLLARLFDAITDPCIGYFCDRYYQKNRSRKPFIFAGGLLIVLSGYCLYVPPETVGAIYFATWFMLFYLAWTLFEIPHLSWAGELATHADDKSKIYSYRGMANYFGLLLFYTIPQLPLFESSEITPETLQFTALIGGILLMVFLVLSLKMVPRYSANSINEFVINTSTSPKIDRGRFSVLWQILYGNKPFLLFNSAILFSSIGVGMWFGLIFIYVDAYLGMGEQFAKMFLLAYIIGLAATPIWCKLAIKYGKRNVWVLASLLTISSFLYTGTLEPENTTFTHLMILKTIQTFGFSCITVIAPAILSEVSDYGTWKYGVERTASYFAIYNFIGKVSAAIATALGLGIAGWYGFDASATRHSDESIQALIVAISWLPPVFLFTALIFIIKNPINSRRHEIIRRQLKVRPKNSMPIRTA